MDNVSRRFSQLISMIFDGSHGTEYKMYQREWNRMCFVKCCVMIVRKPDLHIHRKLVKAIVYSYIIDRQ